MARQIKLYVVYGSQQVSVNQKKKTFKDFFKGVDMLYEKNM